MLDRRDSYSAIPQLEKQLLTMKEAVESSNKTILAELEGMIKKRLGDIDTIEEQGTDNGFYYRKRKSGFCELWHTMTLTNSPYTTTTVFGGYQRYFAVTFPKGLWISPPECVGGYCKVGNGWALWGGIGDSSSVTGARYYCISNVNGSQSCHVSAYWCGWWK